jgi:hypothetical protein
MQIHFDITMLHTPSTNYLHPSNRLPFLFPPKASKVFSHHGISVRSRSLPSHQVQVQLHFLRWGSSGTVLRVSTCDISNKVSAIHTCPTYNDSTVQDNPCRHSCSKDREMGGKGSHWPTASQNSAEQTLQIPWFKYCPTFLFSFAVLGLELRAFTLSHSISPIFVKSFSR